MNVDARSRWGLSKDSGVPESALVDRGRRRGGRCGCSLVDYTGVGLY